MQDLVKKLIIGAFALLTAVSCSKNVPQVEKQTDVYTAGYVEVHAGSTVMRKATLWKNGAGKQLSNTESAANKVIVAGKDVYVAGSEYEGPKSVAKLWKNGTPSQLVNSNINTEAVTFTISENSDVYIVIREWNKTDSEYKVLKNSTYINLSSPNNYSIYQLLDVFVSGSDVYVAGTVKTLGYNSYRATIWKNGTPSFLPTADLGNTNNAAAKVIVSGSDVYVLGTEDKLSQRGIILWKNSTPERFTEDSSEGSGNLFVSGDDVYIVGDRYDLTAPGPVTTLWKNGTPVFNKSSIETQFTSVFVLSDDVYITGRAYFNNAVSFLWTNGVLETPAIENASANSVFVVEK